MVDSVKIVWPYEKHLILKNLISNKHYLVKEPLEITKNEEKKKNNKSLLQRSDIVIDFEHVENNFVDFDMERLLYKMNSNEGPCLCNADFNMDGLEDIFIGGAKGQSAVLFFQNNDGSFSIENEIFELDKNSEDVDCLVGDYNGDGLLDLLVASGGSEFSIFSPELMDRVYFNLGEREFKKSIESLTTIKKFVSTSTISANDFDNDGDLDVFLGTRLNSSSYGTTTKSYMLENDGKGIFTDITQNIAPGLLKMGMVTDSEFVDINNDNNKELVVVGEWMPVKVYEFSNDVFVDISDDLGLDKSNGLYNVLKIVDVNNDSFKDIILGNYGLNSSFKASIDKPLTLLVNDFDNNRKTEQIIGMYYGNDLYPIVQLKDLWMQIPVLKKKYLKFENYKNKKLLELFSKEIIEKTEKKYVYNLASGILVNDLGNKFKLEYLPFEAQLSPIYSILSENLNNDDYDDIIIGGNITTVKPEFGINNASFSLLLLGMKDSKFKSLNSKESGLFVKGEIRDIIKVKVNKKDNYIFAVNNSKLKIFKNENDK